MSQKNDKLSGLIRSGESLWVGILTTVLFMLFGEARLLGPWRPRHKTLPLWAIKE